MEIPKVKLESEQLCVAVVPAVPELNLNLNSLNYTIETDATTYRLGSQLGIAVRGSLFNNSSDTLHLNRPRDESPLRIGCQVISSDGRVVYESRDENTTTGKPFSKVDFELAIPRSKIFPGTYKVLVGLVLEHKLWLREMGFQELDLELIVDSVESVLDVIRMSDDGSGVASVIEYAQGYWKFSEYSQIATLRHACERSETGSTNAFGVAPNIEYLDNRLEDGIVKYTLDLARQEFDIESSIPACSEAAAYWFALNAGKVLGTDNFPVPERVRRLLNRKASVGELCQNDISFLQFMALSAENTKFSIPLRWSEVEKSWVEFIQAHGLHRDLVPDWTINNTSACAALVKGKLGDLPLTSWVYDSLRDKGGYGRIYDIESYGDCVAFLYDIFLHNPSANSVLYRLVGEDAIEFFGGARDYRGLSLMELLTALYCELNVHGDEPLGGFVRKWFAEYVCDIYPAWKRFSTKDRGEVRQAQGYDKGDSDAPVIITFGLTRSQSGLGENYTMLQNALQTLGASYIVADSERPGIASINNPGGRRPAKDVAVFCINADAIPKVLLHNPGERLRSARKIGYLLWELEEIPECHKLALQVLDEIWVPTSFLKSVYEKFTDKPVVNVGKEISVPQDIEPLSLERYGVPSNAFTFLVSFDFHSSVERKNPLAAVRAFQRAFPDTIENVSLIVKTTEVHREHWGDSSGQWKIIERLASQDRRIRILVEHMPTRTFMRLIQSVDCVVSTHRSEGFGYVPAYAMAYGTPVVLTDYSGVTDYANARTAYLVGWTKKSVCDREFIFIVRDAFWADANIDDCAENMIKVFRDQKLREEIVANASALVRDRYMSGSYAKMIEKRLEI